MNSQLRQSKSGTFDVDRLFLDLTSPLSDYRLNILDDKRNPFGRASVIMNVVRERFLPLSGTSPLLYIAYF